MMYASLACHHRTAGVSNIYHWTSLGHRVLASFFSASVRDVFSLNRTICTNDIFTTASGQCALTRVAKVSEHLPEQGNRVSTLAVFHPSTGARTYAIMLHEGSPCSRTPHHQQTPRATLSCGSRLAISSCDNKTYEALRHCPSVLQHSSLPTDLSPRYESSSPAVLSSFLPRQEVPRLTTRADNYQQTKHCAHPSHKSLLLPLQPWQPTATITATPTPTPRPPTTGTPTRSTRARAPTSTANPCSTATSPTEPSRSASAGP